MKSEAAQLQSGGNKYVAEGGTYISAVGFSNRAFQNAAQDFAPRRTFSFEAAAKLKRLRSSTKQTAKSRDFSQ